MTAKPLSRQQNLQWILPAVHGLFLLFLALTFISHSDGLVAGPFTWLGVKIPLVNADWRIGPFFLLPLLVGLGLLGSWWWGYLPEWSWGDGRITIPMLIISLLALPSLITQQELMGFLMLVLFWLSYVTAVNLIVFPQAWSGLTWLLIGVILFQAGVAIYQFVFQRSVGLYGLGEFALTTHTSDFSIVMNGDVRWLRGYGINSHPNRLGWKLVFWLLLLWPIQTYVGRRGQWIVGLTFLVGLGGVLVSVSRSAWLALLMGVSVYVFAWWRGRPLLEQRPSFSRQQKQFAGIVVGVMVLFVVAFSDILISRFSRPTNAIEILPYLERMRDTPLAWQLMWLYPWLGVGPRHYSIMVRTLHPHGGIVHVVPLLIGAEVGVLGLISCLIFWFAPLLRRDLWQNYVPQTAVWLAMMVIGLLQPEPTPFTMQGSLMLGLLAAIWVKPMGKVVESDEGERPFSE